MKSIRRWVTALCGTIALAVACGQVGGGGDSETNWLKTCNADADCRDSGRCICGICTKPCSNGFDCALPDVSAECVSRSRLSSCGASQASNICAAECDGSAQCPSGSQCREGVCTPTRGDSPTGEAGAPSLGGGETGGGGFGGAAPGFGGAGPAGIGGAACTPDPRGSFAGDAARHGVTPLEGSACPRERESFELCSWNPDVSAQNGGVLSSCINGTWTTRENPSQCMPRPQRCDTPNAANNVCCNSPTYCGDGLFCDGVRWWVSN